MSEMNSLHNQVQVHLDLAKTVLLISRIRLFLDDYEKRINRLEEQLHQTHRELVTIREELTRFEIAMKAGV